MEAMESSMALFKNIADASDGVDQLAFKRIVDLHAQTAHMYINDVAVAVEVHVPDLLGNQSAREHFADPAGEQGEQGEFFGSQVQALAAAGDAVGRQIDFQIGNLDRTKLSGGTAPQHRADASEQFREREGLDKVVIGPQFQSSDAILHRIASGKE